MNIVDLIQFLMKAEGLSEGEALRKAPAVWRLLFDRRGTTLIGSAVPEMLRQFMRTRQRQEARLARGRKANLAWASARDEPACA